MAKWGEGDPRWIVEERADATNVNNWHWTEKNATLWSKDKLKSLLEGLVLEDPTYSVTLKEVTKIEGEASANNRKAKLFFFYEWELKVEWKGFIKSDDKGKTYKGAIEIPNLSEEHTAEEVDINVDVSDSSTANACALKEFIRTTGAKKIREKLAQYIVDLKSEFSQGMILPTKDTEAPVPAAPKVSAEPKPVNDCGLSKSLQQQSLGVKIDCKKLTCTEEFKCAVNDLYRALTDREMVSAFTHGTAQLDTQKGGRFNLFNGSVTGEFTDLVQDKKIEMRWRFKTWPDEHYSKVTIELTQKPDCAELRLTQTGVPSWELERTKDGWQQHYWSRIKQTFGFGSFIYN